MTYLVKIIEFSNQVQGLLATIVTTIVGLLTEDCHVDVDYLPVVYLLKHRDQHQR